MTVIALPPARRGTTPHARKPSTIETGSDPVSLLPIVEAAFADHISARAALRRRYTATRAARAQDAWAVVLQLSERAVRAPAPTTPEGLAALATILACSNELVLGDESMSEFAALLRGTLAATGAQLPPGHEGFGEL